MRPPYLLVCIALPLGACASTPRSGPEASQAKDPATSTVGSGAGSALVATLVPMNASGNRVSGRIRLVPTGAPNEYRAEIDLRGGAYQSKFPWVVRTGQCGERGQELGTPATYRLIETGGDGIARVNSTLRLPIPEGQTHHVAILAGPTRRDLVISCGVLSFGT